jgi:putative CocE/NonD family hydrolase
VIDFNAAVRMPDGIVLRADVYHPRGDGKFPVIVFRTPYNKADAEVYGCALATKGYIGVVQDVRGRFASEGAWYPFRSEGQDGYNTVEWAAGLPDSNGKVAMLGASYAGIAQMLTALAQPPHLVAIAPSISPANLHEWGFYQGGAFSELLGETWTSLLAVDSVRRRLLLNWATMKSSDAGMALPLRDYRATNFTGAQDVSPYFADWLKHPGYDEYWKALSFEDQASKVQIPIFWIGGWYDIFTNGTLSGFSVVQSQGGSSLARRGGRLVMGPWTHTGFERTVGDVDFGPNADINDFSLALRWYDYLLKGIKNGSESDKPVKIFVMGKNVWREEDNWPLVRAHATRFYIHSDGAANSVKGDGKLSTAPPQNEPGDRYTYDPSNPVPTRGGGLCCSAEFPGGAFDQSSVEARQDVLIYSTPALKEDLEVTGPITVELYVSSNVADTDFTGKLVDVSPDGLARNVSDGILRMRYRNSKDAAVAMHPGETYKIQISMSAASNVFLAGHRIRLEISSSNFPRFSRNLNTIEDLGGAVHVCSANNVILHDHEHPSAVVLPVIP